MAALSDVVDMLIGEEVLVLAETDTGIMKHVIIRENTKITAINLDLCSDFIFITFPFASLKAQNGMKPLHLSLFYFTAILYHTS
jgi:hypothetical protein